MPFHIKVRQMMKNNEEVDTTIPKIFSSPEDGVLFATDIRTDKFELAIEASEAKHKTDIAGGDGVQGKETKLDGKEKPDEGGGKKE